MGFSVKDQLNHEVQLPGLPRRIVSLVPSQTELLFDLGLGAFIVGITNYCIYPSDKVKDIPKVGGTKNFNIKTIKKLNPDLIIGNKEENERKGIDTLKKFFPVWMSDIFCLEDALDMITRVGILTGKSPEADSIVSRIQRNFSFLPPSGTISKPVAYLIWRKPYMVAASKTFIDDMLQRVGFTNAFASLVRYPELTAGQLQEAQPAYIFLSSEPYPFKEKHLAEFQTLCPEAKVLVVDGELFSWYGSRLEHSAAYFSKLALVG